MNADQLIQQYDAGAITARELVEGVWRIVECDTECSHGGSWRFKENHPLSILGWFGWTEKSPCASGKLYSAAAEFTRERIEKIRQVKEEIAQMQDHVDMKNQDIEREMEILLDSECNEFDMEAIVTFVRDLCAYCRILTARQAALAYLRQGINPEALNGR